MPNVSRVLGNILSNSVREHVNRHYFLKRQFDNIC